MDWLIAEIRKIDTFRSLSPSDITALAKICIPANYPPRKAIAQEGLDAENIFALITGTVGIWVDYGTDKADLLAVREAPCLVGELSVADQLPRSATIVSGTPVAGYTIDARAFRKLLEERGSIALALVGGISKLVRSSNDSFVSELRQHNEELMRANAELTNAQRQLVRQERLSSLGKFSSMIIHDLRNPLSVIMGYVDLLKLRLEDRDGEIYQYVSQIRQETSRLTGLTSEWLDYTRGEIRLAYAPVTVEKLFDQLHENVKSFINAKGLTVKWNREFRGTVLLDFNRTLRMIVNLVDNACKACSRGGCIEISANQDIDHMLLSVKDDGIGMNRETLDHVFEPFYSASDRGGTGLGMHIAKSIVEAHGGSVDVKSSPGVGTEISIRLPLRV